MKLLSLLIGVVLLAGCSNSITDEYGRIDHGIAGNIRWGNNRLVLLGEQLDRIESKMIDKQVCLDRCTTAILEVCDDHLDGSMCQYDANFHCDKICQVTYPR